ncbi:MAG: OmpA family protein [Gammaproteobacteria bacterium]|nr:OmpA family protein [Gammaproteobacteria bacterium]
MSRFTTLAVSTLALVSLVACSTIDPYTREEKTSNATKGALIGAGAGAVFGLLTGDDADERRKRALIGAGAGALAGSAVGSYMDTQENELRKKLDRTGVSVTRNGDQIILNMPGNVTFDTGRDEIKSSFYPILDSVVTVVEKYEKTVIDVVGHTDSTGSDAINQPLSERRASSVGSYLNSHGVDTLRVLTQGVGSSYPVASNSTATGRSQNRRVEISLRPLTR